MRPAGSILAAVLGLAPLCACAPPGSPTLGASPPAVAVRAGAFEPSRAVVAPSPSLSALALADVDSCARCHAEIVAEYRASAHAHASFGNPWYRASVERFRADRGARTSRFCGGCHDPLLMVSGRLDEEVAPDDEVAHAGVTCLVCHGVTAADSHGNASWQLSAEPVPVPAPGDADSLARHRARLVHAPLRSAALCGSCHRSVLGPRTGHPHLGGIDDLGAWSASAYAGSRAERLDPDVTERDCTGCHMPRREGGRRSHRFAGAHTTLAAQLADPEQVAAVAQQLRGAVGVDVAGVRHPDGRWALPAEAAELSPGDLVELLVVVRNLGAGHMFPGGTRDLQDTWVEVRVALADGRPLLRAGADHEVGDDPSAYVLRSVVLDGEGRPDRLHDVHRFRAPGFDLTVPPRGARAIRYELRVPDDVAPSSLPLVATARVRHRRHPLDFQRVACQSARTAVGRAFAEAGAARGVELDPCAPQPVSELAAATVPLGGGAPGGAPERLYGLALALSDDVLDDLPDAVRVLDRLLELPVDPASAARAMILRSRVEGRLGRADAALTWAARAQERVGPHPAIDRARAHALARVFRYGEAAEHYRRVADEAPADAQAWRDLTSALASAGRVDEALDAVERGLSLAPDDEGMLHVRARGLEALGRPAEEARRRWLARPLPEDRDALLFECERGVPGCRRDRQPVPYIPLGWHGTR